MKLSALEGLFAAMMVLYSGGVEFGFSDTLLDNPNARVPWFACAWVILSLLTLANASKAAGNGTWTAVTARALTPCVFAVGLGAAKLTGEAQLIFIGLLSIVIIWAIHLAALANSHSGAFQLFAFLGFPVFLLTHLVLFFTDRLTPVMLWLEPADDATRWKLHVGATLIRCFQSAQLLVCVCTRKCGPRHLPHDRPKNEAICDATASTSSSMLGVLSITGVAAAFIIHLAYENIFLNAAIMQSISFGAERHILGRLQLPEGSSERAALYGAIAISVVGGVVTVSRGSRMQIEPRLTPVCPALGLLFSLLRCTASQSGPRDAIGKKIMVGTSEAACRQHFRSRGYT